MEDIRTKINKLKENISLELQIRFNELEIERLNK